LPGRACKRYNAAVIGHSHALFCHRSGMSPLHQQLTDIHGNTPQMRFSILGQASHGTYARKSFDRSYPHPEVFMTIASSPSPSIFLGPGANVFSPLLRGSRGSCPCGGQRRRNSPAPSPRQPAQAKALQARDVASELNCRVSALSARSPSSRHAFLLRTPTGAKPLRINRLRDTGESLSGPFQHRLKRASRHQTRKTVLTIFAPREKPAGNRRRIRQNLRQNPRKANGPEKRTLIRLLDNTRAHIDQMHIMHAARTSPSYRPSNDRQRSICFNGFFHAAGRPFSSNSLIR